MSLKITTLSDLITRLVLQGFEVCFWNGDPKEKTMTLEIYDDSLELLSCILRQNGTMSDLTKSLSHFIKTNLEKN